MLRNIFKIELWKSDCKKHKIILITTTLEMDI